MNTTPLRQAREKRGLSLEDVAQKLHLDRGHLSRKERGERPIDPDEAKVLHDLYDGEVSYEQMFGVPATTAAAKRSLRERRT